MKKTLDIEYDSQKSSDSNEEIQSIDSSEDSQYDENINQTQKDELKRLRKIKSGRAYQHANKKEQQLIARILNHWKEETLTNYRCNLMQAIKHYQRTLLMKGFDGLIEYATVSMSFKEKLVLFYYGYILKGYFGRWKQLYKEGQLNKDKMRDLQESCSSISKVNEIVDEIQRKAQNFEYHNSHDSDVELQEQKQKHLNKSHSTSFNHEFKPLKKEQTFKIIQKTQKQQTKQRMQSSSKIKQPEQTFLNKLPPKIQKIDSSLINTREEGSIFRYQNLTMDRGFLTGMQSRQNSLLGNSRTSTNTFYNEIGRSLNQNKSQRKLKPIKEQIKLPSCGLQKSVMSRKSEQVVQPRKSIQEQMLSDQLKKDEEKSQIQEEQKARQELMRIEEQKQQKFQKQKKQKLAAEKQKECQARKNEILQILAKTKMYEICLLKQMQKESPNFAQFYKVASIQTLNSIKLI